MQLQACVREAALFRTLFFESSMTEDIVPDGEEHPPAAVEDAAATTRAVVNSCLQSLLEQVTNIREENTITTTTAEGLGQTDDGSCQETEAVSHAPVDIPVKSEAKSLLVEAASELRMDFVETGPDFTANGAGVVRALLQVSSLSTVDDDPGRCAGGSSPILR